MATGGGPPPPPDEWKKKKYPSSIDALDVFFAQQCNVSLEESKRSKRPRSAEDKEQVRLWNEQNKDRVAQFQAEALAQKLSPSRGDLQDIRDDHEASRSARTSRASSVSSISEQAQASEPQVNGHGGEMNYNTGTGSWDSEEEFTLQECLDEIDAHVERMELLIETIENPTSRIAQKFLIQISETAQQIVEIHNENRVGLDRCFREIPEMIVEVVRRANEARWSWCESAVTEVMDVVENLRIAVDHWKQEVAPEYSV